MNNRDDYYDDDDDDEWDYDDRGRTQPVAKPAPAPQKESAGDPKVWLLGVIAVLLGLIAYNSAQDESAPAPVYFVEGSGRGADSAPTADSRVCLSDDGRRLEYGSSCDDPYSDPAYGYYSDYYDDYDDSYYDHYDDYDRYDRWENYP